MPRNINRLLAEGAGVVITVAFAIYVQSRPTWTIDHPTLTSWLYRCAFVAGGYLALSFALQWRWVQVAFGICPQGSDRSVAEFEKAIEEILVRKGVAPGDAKQLPEETPKDEPPSVPAKLDGEIYRIVRSDKLAYSDLTRQLWEGVNPGKEFAIDVDILVEMYVVNTSSETQYIRDFRGSVEIDGVRIPLIRESDFFAYTIGDGHDYEYCLDQPNERLAILGGPSETLRPLFATLPISLEERKPTEGWVRFLLKERDPRKLEGNRTYEFVLVDSLGVEYQISRSANPPRTTPAVTSRKKGKPGQ